MREVSNPEESFASESNNSMQDYYKLQWELLVTTLILTGIFFVFVWYFYSLTIALNYLLGACTGVVYLKVLARNVEQVGSENRKVGRSQIAIFVGLILVATQWKQLQILPIFLGFLTYKAALLVYMLRILMPSDSR
ncbi:MAG: ATP synthase subunit I [Leptolyngbyaceae cyanobacterium bins.349]|nr:ATP synthase subunit I [Leptolyngbyaceae cyanobacterium bins.349]